MAETKSSSPPPAKAQKRQREEDDFQETQPTSTSTANPPKEGPSKKKKRKKAKKAAEDEKDADKKDGINESIGKMDGRLLADHFAQQAKRHNKELTAVELNDLYVPGEPRPPLSLLAFSGYYCLIQSRTGIFRYIIMAINEKIGKPAFFP